MDKKKKVIEIKLVKYPNLQKCNCCNRVKDIYYKVLIYNAKTEGRYEEVGDYIVGDLDFCKTCGDNFAEAIGESSPPDEKTVKVFEF